MIVSGSTPCITCIHFQSVATDGCSLLCVVFAYFFSRVRFFFYIITYSIISPYIASVIIVLCMSSPAAASVRLSVQIVDPLDDRRRRRCWSPSKKGFPLQQVSICHRSRCRANGMYTFLKIILERRKRTKRWYMKRKQRARKKKSPAFKLPILYKVRFIINPYSKNIIKST